MFLLVVVCREKPDERFVGLTFVCTVMVTSRMISEMIDRRRQENLLRDHLLVNSVLQVIVVINKRELRVRVDDRTERGGKVYKSFHQLFVSYFLAFLSCCQMAFTRKCLGTRHFSAVDFLIEINVSNKSLLELSSCRPIDILI